MRVNSEPVQKYKKTTKKRNRFLGEQRNKSSQTRSVRVAFNKPYARSKVPLIIHPSQNQIKSQIIAAEELLVEFLLRNVTYYSRSLHRGRFGSHKQY